MLTTSRPYHKLEHEQHVPLEQGRTRGSSEKLERKVGDYAVIGVAAQLVLDASGDVVQAGIGLCNAASTSIKATAAEAFLVGKPTAPDNINEAARLAMEASDPVDDDRGPIDYKRAMVRELTRRALRRALARAQGAQA